MIEANRYRHVTFETSDLERQIAYFTEVAGLVVAERENGLRMAFWRRECPPTVTNLLVYSIR
jgi:catechol 2,3-dioxygenase-like lactoylglutathione lyase family enzyme